MPITVVKNGDNSPKKAVALPNILSEKFDGISMVVVDILLRGGTS